MAGAPTTLDDVKLGRVFLDLENPRHEPFTSEPQTIEYLCEFEGVYPLARDIAVHGLNPLERFALVPVKARGGKTTGYIMAEGNRRLCAIKLLTDPELAPANLRKAFEKLSENWAPITSVSGVVFDNMDDAKIWLERIHSGTQGGVGRKEWNSEQKERFSGGAKNRTAQLFLDYAEAEEMITAEERKGKITTVQRFLGNDVFREILGLDHSAPDQLGRTRPKDEFDILARRFVRDLVQKKDVNSRMNKEQIIQYARPLSSMAGVTSARVPTEALSSDPAPKPTPKRSTPRKPAQAKHVEYEEDIASALKSYGNGKLESLYHSICTIDLDPHTPMVAIGTWAFFESLTACAGRNDSTSFDSFLSNSKLESYGVGSSDRTAIRAALGRIRDYGNITKHHSIAGTFNGDQLNNDMIALKTVILGCIEEAAIRAP